MHDPTAATPDAAATDDLFAGGPLLRVRARLPLLRGGRHIVRRVVAFVLVAWFPLLLLATLYGGEGKPLLRDLGAFSRYVVAGPLLLAAEAVCLVMLGNLARRFLALLPTPDGRAAYAHTVDSVRRLLGHPLADVAVVVLAYLL